MFEELGNVSSALEAALVRAEAVSRGGAPAEALAIIAAAEREAHVEAAFSLPRTCLQRGWALLALGRPEEAAEMVSTGLVAAREQGLPYEEALLLRLGSRVDRQRGDTGGGVSGLGGRRRHAGPPRGARIAPTRRWDRRQPLPIRASP